MSGLKGWMLDDGALSLHEIAAMTRLYSLGSKLRYATNFTNFAALGHRRVLAKINKIGFNTMKQHT